MSATFYEQFAILYRFAKRMLLKDGASKQDLTATCKHSKTKTKKHIYICFQSTAEKLTVELRRLLNSKGQRECKNSHEN